MKKNNNDYEFGDEGVKPIQNNQLSNKVLIIDDLNLDNNNKNESEKENEKAEENNENSNDNQKV